MITISLCMIVKNEEDVLKRCLESVCDTVDEIIIVDTGSTDSTKEIAGSFTENVYDFKWVDDFAAARNFSFSKATMQYCMWLDADDVLLEEDRKKLLLLKETLEPNTAVVMLPYHTGFDENGNITFSYYRERILKNHMGFVWQGAVHEAISPSGEIYYGNVAITHQKLHPSDPDRNLKIFEKLLSEGKTLEPRQQFYYARELYYHARYEEAITILRSFLEEGLGWIENHIDACKLLAQCYQLSGKKSEAFTALFRSFVYDTPRAEICCEIGRLMMEAGMDKQAIYWYECALCAQKPAYTGAFIEEDCYGYIPCIQLCVLQYRMGNIGLAREYNERAGQFKPMDKAYRFNCDFFANQIRAGI